MFQLMEVQPVGMDSPPLSVQTAVVDALCLSTGCPISIASQVVQSAIFSLSGRYGDYVPEAAAAALVQLPSDAEGTHARPVGRRLALRIAEEACQRMMSRTRTAVPSDQTGDDHCL
jgi:hypothetical protein